MADNQPDEEVADQEVVRRMTVVSEAPTATIKAGELTKQSAGLIKNWREQNSSYVWLWCRSLMFKSPTSSASDGSLARGLNGIARGCVCPAPDTLGKRWFVLTK